jgi:hypothetical protein
MNSQQAPRAATLKLNFDVFSLQGQPVRVAVDPGRIRKIFVQGNLISSAFNLSAIVVDEGLADDPELAKCIDNHDGMKILVSRTSAAELVADIRKVRPDFPDYERPRVTSEFQGTGCDFF